MAIICLFWYKSKYDAQYIQIIPQNMQARFPSNRVPNCQLRERKEIDTKIGGNATMNVIGRNVHSFFSE